MDIKSKIHNWINTSDDNYTDSEAYEEEDFDFRPGDEEQPAAQSAPKPSPSVQRVKETMLFQLIPQSRFRQPSPELFSKK